MTNQDTHPGYQAARQVYESYTPAEEPVSLHIFHLPYHLDPSSGKDIIFWDDIVSIFKEDILHVRTGTIILPLLKGSDFKSLQPLRIYAVPGITLDVAVKSRSSEMEISLETLVGTLPRTHQDDYSSASVSSTPTLGDVNTTIGRSPAYGSEDTAMGNYNHTDKPVHLTPAKGGSVNRLITNGHVTPVTAVTGSSNTSTTSTTTTIESFAGIDGITMRNPEGGLEGAAMDNYTHMDNPTARSIPRPIRRGPQLHPETNDNTSQNSFPSDITLSHAPQYDNGVKDITQTIIDANLGDTKAQVALGQMCKHGREVNRDYKAAMNWFLRAAKQGDSIGALNVGILYRDGVGVKQNYFEAKHWFQKLAENGDAAGQIHLGCMHEHGQGEVQNYSMAMFWYLESAKQGHRGAHTNIGYMYQMGLGVELNTSVAMEWYIKAAELGDPDAQNSIGYMYQRGLGVKQDTSLAMVWYIKAAEQENPQAHNNIGYMYQMGLGVKQDTSRALECYVKAAERGQPTSHTNVGWLCESNFVSHEGVAMAIQWYKAAVDLGESDAKWFLDKLQQQGYDLETGKKR